MAKLKKFDLEKVYDAEIAPLMTKIIDICKERKLPMFATFLYANDPNGDDSLCTTTLMFDERPIPDALKKLASTLLPDSRPSMRLRVTNKEGQVTDDTIILG